MRTAESGTLSSIPRVFYSISMSNQIVTTPNQVLRKNAIAVKETEFGTSGLVKTIDAMSKALRATSEGIGIAAPQIGISKRIFLASEEALVIDKKLKHPDDRFGKEKDTDKKWEYYTFINPEIIKISTKKFNGVEGCLSVPKKYGEVERAEKIRVRARDEKGHVFERGASKLFARLIQHEIDHLNGVLFIDKVKKLTVVKETENT